MAQFLSYRFHFGWRECATQHNVFACGASYLQTSATRATVTSLKRHACCVARRAPNSSHVSNTAEELSAALEAARGLAAVSFLRRPPVLASGDLVASSHLLPFGMRRTRHTTNSQTASHHFIEACHFIVAKVLSPSHSFREPTSSSELQRLSACCICSTTVRIKHFTSRACLIGFLVLFSVVGLISTLSTQYKLSLGVRSI